eukprot:5284257-Alexandrium_andersonii.AAC.1
MQPYCQRMCSGTGPIQETRWRAQGQSEAVPTHANPLRAAQLQHSVHPTVEHSNTGRNRGRHLGQKSAATPKHE